MHVHYLVVVLFRYFPVLTSKQHTRPIIKNEAATLIPNNSEYLRFGEVMDIDDERVIIGNYILNQALIFKINNRTWMQEAILNTSDGSRNYFGRSVAIKGELAVVGASHDTNNGLKHSGSVYVFTYVNSSWIEDAKLSPRDAVRHHYFGYSVAIEKYHMVVGCPSDKSQSGAVYIFTKINNVWKQQMKLLPSDPEKFNFFGHSVSTDSRHIVVGTLHDNGNKDILSGAAYVFKKIGKSWYQQMKIHPTKKLRDYRDDEFGYSIALRHNYIIIGCPGDTINGVGSGAAYIYYRNKENVWIESVKIYPSDGVPNDYFGSSVDIAEGFVVIGSRRGHYNEIQPGTAYIFQRLGSKWIQRSKLVNSKGEDDANFGFTVAINQNYTIIGCPWCRKEGNISRGSAYVFNNIDSEIV